MYQSLRASAPVLTISNVFLRAVTKTAADGKYRECRIFVPDPDLQNQILILTESPSYSHEHTSLKNTQYCTLK